MSSSKLEVDVASACEACGTDTWLVERFSEIDTTDGDDEGTAYEFMTSIGCTVRMCLDEGGKKQGVKFAKALDGENLGYWLEIFQAAVMQFSQFVAESFHPGQRTDADLLHSACLWRDDIASVSAVLEIALGEAPLQEPVAFVDQWAEEHVATRFKSIPKINDEQLYRARMFNCDVATPWWLQHVVEPN